MQTNKAQEKVLSENMFAAQLDGFSQILDVSLANLTMVRLNGSISLDKISCGRITNERGEEFLVMPVSVSHISSSQIEAQQTFHNDEGSFIFTSADGRIECASFVRLNQNNGELISTNVPLDQSTPKTVSQIKTQKTFDYVEGSSTFSVDGASSRGDGASSVGNFHQNNGYVTDLKENSTNKPLSRSTPRTVIQHARDENREKSETNEVIVASQLRKVLCPECNDCHTCYLFKPTMAPSSSPMTTNISKSPDSAKRKPNNDRSDAHRKRMKSVNETKTTDDTDSSTEGENEMPNQTVIERTVTVPTNGESEGRAHESVTWESIERNDTDATKQEQLGHVVCCHICGLPRLPPKNKSAGSDEKENETPTNDGMVRRSARVKNQSNGPMKESGPMMDISNVSKRSHEQRNESRYVDTRTVRGKRKGNESNRR